MAIATTTRFIAASISSVSGWGGRLPLTRAKIRMVISPTLASRMRGAPSTTTCGNGFAWPMTSCSPMLLPSQDRVVCGLLDDRVLQRADTLDLDPHDVAGLEQHRRLAHD